MRLLGNEAERVLSYFASTVIITASIIFTVSCGPALGSILQIAYLISSVLYSCEVRITIPILQVEDRLREVQSLAQAHKAISW